MPIARIRIADHYRSRERLSAWEGLHVTALPEEAAAACGRDFSGAGRTDVPAISGRLSRGQAGARLHVGGGAHAGARSADSPRSDPAQLYLVPNSIVVTRGCPQHCDFCYKDAFFQGGRGFYTQRVDDALAEIDRCRGGISIFSTIICSATGALRKRSSRG
jgi:hypothetical protein